MGTNLDYILEMLYEAEDKAKCRQDKRLIREIRNKLIEYMEEHEND